MAYNGRGSLGFGRAGRLCLPDGVAQNSLEIQVAGGHSLHPIDGPSNICGYELGSPLFINKTVVEELPFAVERTAERVIDSTQDALDGPTPLPVSQGGPESPPNASTETRPTPTLGEEAPPVPDVADETTALSSPEGG